MSTETSKNQMDEMMDEIDKSMKNIQSGDIVEGEIISVNDKEVLVNIGYIADGIVTANELANAAAKLL